MRQIGRPRGAKKRKNLWDEYDVDGEPAYIPPRQQIGVEYSITHARPAARATGLSTVPSSPLSALSPIAPSSPVESPGITALPLPLRLEDDMDNLYQHDHRAAEDIHMEELFSALHVSSDAAAPVQLDEGRIAEILVRRTSACTHHGSFG